MLCYENGLTYPVYVSDQKFENCMDFLPITDENKSHYIYIKDFNRFMCNKTKNKNEKYFCKCCLQCFSSGKILIKHKENCLIKNIRHIFIGVLLIKLFMLIINSLKKNCSLQKKNAVYRLIEAILEEYECCKKITYYVSNLNM